MLNFNNFNFQKCDKIVILSYIKTKWKKREIPIYFYFLIAALIPFGMRVQNWVNPTGVVI